MAIDKSNLEELDDARQQGALEHALCEHISSCMRMIDYNDIVELPLPVLRRLRDKSGMLNRYLSEPVTAEEHRKFSPSYTSACELSRDIEAMLD